MVIIYIATVFSFFALIYCYVKRAAFYELQFLYNTFILLKQKNHSKDECIDKINNILDIVHSNKTDTDKINNILDIVHSNKTDTDNIEAGTKKEYHITELSISDRIVLLPLKKFQILLGLIFLACLLLIVNYFGSAADYSWFVYISQLVYNYTISTIVSILFLILCEMFAISKNK